MFWWQSPALYMELSLAFSDFQEKVLVTQVLVSVTYIMWEGSHAGAPTLQSSLGMAVSYNYL